MTMRDGSPEKLSDIEICRVFEVNCYDCGVIDAPSDIETARRSRRLHFERAHAKNGKAD